MASLQRVSSTSSPRNGRSEPPELEDFARFCEILQVENGRPLTLHPYQRRMLTDYFAGARETLILLPKKNGKTTMMAALALYHLLVTRDAECVIGAAAREQAQIMLKQARKFIGQWEDLSRLMHVSQRQILSSQDEGVIKVLSSEADTGDGVIPTLALVDELHRHKSGDLYGVFRDGLEPRNGQIITISTAGDDDQSSLGEIRTKAYTYGIERDGAYRYARSPSGDFVMHEWALDDGEDRDDLDLVKTANPAPWHTIKALRMRHDSPSMTPWQWARFACGVWLSGENRVISPTEWDACGLDEIPLPPDDVVPMFGIDLGWKDDNTAVVVYWRVGEIAYIGKVVILEPPADGGLRKSVVLDAVEGLRAEFGGSEIVIDPETGGEILAQDLEERGFSVTAHSQKPQVMATAAERFYAAVRECRIRHPRDPGFTRHVLNAVAMSTIDGRWRFVKESKQSKRHIDALIAAAMVHSVATQPEAGVWMSFA